MMRKLLLLLIFLGFALDASAQQQSKAGTPGIMEANAFVAYLRAGDTNARNASPTNSYSQAQSVEDLLRKVQPSQYYSQGVVNTYGAKPRHLFVDVQSLNNLNNPALLKNNIDIITVRINTASDLNATINLAAFASFLNLKYVHIASAVPASASAIAAMVTNPQERLNVFYSIQSGEGNQ